MSSSSCCSISSDSNSIFVINNIIKNNYKKIQKAKKAIPRTSPISLTWGHRVSEHLSVCKTFVE